MDDTGIGPTAAIDGADLLDQRTPAAREALTDQEAEPGTAEIGMREVGEADLLEQAATPTINEDEDDYPHSDPYIRCRE